MIFTDLFRRHLSVLPKIVELLDSAVSGRLRVGLYGRSWTGS